MNNPYRDPNCLTMRHIIEKLLSQMIMSAMIGALLTSCERDDDIKILFGYDPDFNYFTVLKSSPAYSKC